MMWPLIILTQESFLVCLYNLLTLTFVQFWRDTGSHAQTSWRARRHKLQILYKIVSKYIKNVVGRKVCVIWSYSLLGRSLAGHRRPSGASRQIWRRLAPLGLTREAPASLHRRLVHANDRDRAGCAASDRVASRRAACGGVVHSTTYVGSSLTKPSIMAVGYPVVTIAKLSANNLICIHIASNRK